MEGDGHGHANMEGDGHVRANMEGEGRRHAKMEGDGHGHAKMEGDEPYPDTYTARAIAETVRTYDIEQIIVHECYVCGEPDIILGFDPSTAAGSCLLSQCKCLGLPFATNYRMGLTMENAAKLLNSTHNQFGHFFPVMRTSDEGFNRTVACNLLKECVPVQDDKADDDTDNDNDDTKV